MNINDGDLVIFPGWLPHMTEVSNSNESRYVISINYNGES